MHRRDPFGLRRQGRAINLGGTHSLRAARDSLGCKQSGPRHCSIARSETLHRMFTEQLQHSGILPSAGLPAIPRLQLAAQFVEPRRQSASCGIRPCGPGRAGLRERIAR